MLKRNTMLAMMLLLSLLIFSNNALAFIKGTYTGSGTTITVDSSGLVSSVALSTTIYGSCWDVVTGYFSCQQSIATTIYPAAFSKNITTSFTSSGNIDKDTTYSFDGSLITSTNPYIITLKQSFVYSYSYRVGLAEGGGYASGSSSIDLYHDTLTNDKVAPRITSFVVPATSSFVYSATRNSLTVPIKSFTAVDTPRYGIVSYQITESATAPSASIGWSATPPSSYIFHFGDTSSSYGTKTLYAWAKDFKGNISTSRSATIVPPKSNQTVDFSTIPTINRNETLTLSATATSGLSVSFTSMTPDICTVSGNRVTAIKAGTCTIAANQAGNDDYNPATQVKQSFTISQINISAIVAGAYHTCALTTASGVKCWGFNKFGQLGNNTVTDSYTPVDVQGLSSGVVTIVAGFAHTCAITTSVGVKCWGWNGAGQLGNDTLTDSYVPVDVHELWGGIFPLSVATLGDGSGSITSKPAGIACNSKCRAVFTSGSNVTLTATPAAGSIFVGWAGACRGVSTCTVKMSGSTKNVTAKFKLN